MSVIESHWRERQSRYKDGIYFTTDDFIELCGSPSEGGRLLKQRLPVPPEIPIQP